MSESEVKSDIWLDRAKTAYLSSTSFIDNNYRKQWENWLRHFQSKHHSGSKFNKSSHKYRSKVFRPKTRAAIRSNEAACAGIFFSNQDVITIEPRDQNNPIQAASAALTKEVVQYRLTETVPWFMTCIGAFQDGQVVGVIASYQHWIYQEKKVKYKQEVEIVSDNALKATETEEGAIVEETIVLKDQPDIDLMPVENIRIHPNADWRDPANSSPYLIRLVPMYVKDVKAKMKEIDPKTKQPKWKPLSDGEIRAASKMQHDSTRSTREGQREDKSDSENVKALSDYDIVWVHENYMHHEMEDYVFWTLGVEHRLTEPEHTEDVYEFVKKGERPVVIGCAVIETHKIFSTSPAGLGEPVQKELNEVANQRLDNVKFVLNKRWFAKRGAQVDLRSIVRNVAGSVTLMNNPKTDVVAHDFADVTGSSYQEQDRLNLDFDDVVGAFSASTVQSNRKMNETVGGMQMMRGGVNALTEYLLMTFGETWAEPVLKQFVRMEQTYETDMVIWALAAEKAQLFQKFGVERITDELLSQSLTIRVNVGIGSTDPAFRLEKFLLGVRNSMEIEAAAPPTMNLEEVQKEIWGKLGYKDGARFYNRQGDPKLIKLQQQMEGMAQMIQQLQAQIADKNAERQAKLVTTQIKEQGQTHRKAMDIDAKLTDRRMQESGDDRRKLLDVRSRPNQ